MFSISGEKYRLTVKTGLRPLASTNSKVWVRLTGTTFRTRDHELDNPGDDFKPGSSTEYVFHDYPIGKVSGAVLSCWTWLAAQRTIAMLVYRRCESARVILRAATLRQRL